MKRRLPIYIFGLLFPLVLGSCQTDYSFVPYDDYVTPLATKKNIDNEVYYRNDHYENLTYENFDRSVGNIASYRDLYDSRVDNRPYLNIPGTGEQDILVIPVGFSNSSKNDKDDKLNKIKNVFFGKENLTTYESVASFYNKSSYGHLQLKGKVSDWFELDMSSSELKSNIHSTVLASRYVASQAIEWYLESNDDLATFDHDNDGYIDGLFLVYDAPYESASDLFWAYTDRMSKGETFKTLKGEEKTINTNEIGINGYVWASLDFIKTAGKRVDSHVFSHETGHLFGLLDYYSQFTYQPTGFMDMMDYNLGDHTGWSKMLLNWLTPNVLKNAGTINLESFAETGELFLVPSNDWNGTPYDEFLLLEFYTPTGLNAKDIYLRFAYEDQNGEKTKGHLFNYLGVKVYHVDARLGYYENKVTRKLISSFDDPNVSTKLEEYRLSGKTGYYIGFLNSNNISNPETQNPIYHLLEKSGENTFINGMPATNETLFRTGDSFGYSTFSDFTFNSGAALEYKFTVSALSSTSATINFVLKNAQMI